MNLLKMEGRMIFLLLLLYVNYQINIKSCNNVSLFNLFSNSFSVIESLTYERNNLIKLKKDSIHNIINKNGTNNLKKR